jgi:hypothetical protein
VVYLTEILILAGFYWLRGSLWRSTHRPCSEMAGIGCRWGAHAFAPSARAWAATIELRLDLWPVHPWKLAYWRKTPELWPPSNLQACFYGRSHLVVPLFSYRCCFPTVYRRQSLLIHQTQIPRYNDYHDQCSSVELELPSTLVRFKLTSTFIT